MRVGIRWTLLMTVILAAGCRDHSQDVVVIEKTGSYHTEECPRVKMAYTEIMPLSQAVALHFKPCPKCKPHEND